QNLGVEQRWANNEYDRLPEMARDLVRAQVSLIVAHRQQSVCPRRQGCNFDNSHCFITGADPVALGLVASLNHPGGNIAGVTTTIVDILQKRLQLLHDLVPNARRFGYLVNPDNFGPTCSAGRTQIELSENAVRTWGGTVEVASA